jgi:hypothetical protein
MGVRQSRAMMKPSSQAVKIERRMPDPLDKITFFPNCQHLTSTMQPLAGEAGIFLMTVPRGYFKE